MKKVILAGLLLLGGSNFSLAADLYDLDVLTKNAKAASLLKAGPITNAWINLNSGSPKFSTVVQKEKTGKDGTVLFKKVGPGSYRLKVLQFVEVPGTNDRVMVTDSLGYRQRKTGVVDLKVSLVKHPGAKMIALEVEELEAEAPKAAPQRQMSMREMMTDANMFARTSSIADLDAAIADYEEKKKTASASEAFRLDIYLKEFKEVRERRTVKK